MSKAGAGKLGPWAVVAIGVGGMVGGGIFAVLGLAVELAHGGTPVAFALAGAVALLTANDVRNPARTLPRAYYTAVGFVIALYVSVALVAVGNLSVRKIVAAKDYALAEAARPFLGGAGFALIAVAAMLSTASAINATLYGTARLSYCIARDGELPAVLERKVWGKPAEGLLITAGLTLLVANALDMTSIATLGSAGFLLIFAAVNAANARHASHTNSHAWISTAGAGACVAAFGALVWQTARTGPTKLWVLAVMVALAVLVEGGYRLAKREIRLHD